MEGACKQGGGVDLWGQVLKVVVKVSLSRGLCTGCVLAQLWEHPNETKSWLAFAGISKGETHPLA